ncbi:MAG: ketose-bisphosphate aldolase [Firmicutes bacterium]|nr:ketose-bisphosphate aldolase [Bacillota bacterium]
MKKTLLTTKILLERAKKRNRAIVAFNVNNMELIQAITRACDEMKCDVILQVSNSAKKYATEVYLRKLVEAARESVGIDIALHLDHGADFEQCKAAIDAGFTSVMIDGSHLPFDQNIAVTKKVVDYAKKHGVSVEGELGQIAGIEDEKKNEDSQYTDPSTVKEFVEKTGVDALAVSIGTAHGAFKYKSAPAFRFDILERIQKEIPNTPLVLHGASSVTPADVATINKFGGKIENAKGVSEDILAKAIPLGVRKINVDSDLRLAMTASIRKTFATNPSEFDPRAYLGQARLDVMEVVKTKLKAFSV